MVRPLILLTILMKKNRLILIFVLILILVIVIKNINRTEIEDKKNQRFFNVN